MDLQNDFNMGLGKVIRTERKMRGLTMRELSEKIGVSCQQLQKYETGRNAPTVWRTVQIAGMFGLDVGTLIARALGMRPPPLEGATDEALLLLRLYAQLSHKEQRAIVACAQSLSSI